MLDYPVHTQPNCVPTLAEERDAGNKDTVQVAVFDPHEVDVAVGQHGTEEPLLFVLHQQRHEVVDLSHVHIALVVPTDQHLEEDGALTEHFWDSHSP